MAIMTTTTEITFQMPKDKQMWNFCPNCGAKMRGEQDG